MRIGIYGDSYAHPLWKNIDDNLYTDYSWALRLADDYNVTNHAESGSALEYSYWKFLLNHEQNDLNIVISSSCSRTTVFKNSGSFYDTQSYDEKVKCIDVAIHYANYNMDFEYGVPVEQQSHADGRIMSGLFEAGVTYPEFNFLHHYAMESNMKLLRPETIIIPGFNNFQQFRTGAAMRYISEIDYNKFGSQDEIWARRPHHMSAAQNMQFYEYMKRAVTHGFDIVGTLAFDTVGECYAPSNTIYDSGLRW